MPGKNLRSTGSAAPLIDIDAVAERLGITVRHVRRLVSERRIPYVKVGHLVRFDPAEIAAWIDAARRPLLPGHPGLDTLGQLRRRDGLGAGGRRRR